MNAQNRLSEILRFLFERNWEEELTEEQEDELRDQASAVVQEYGWQEVYAATFEFLIKNCTTPEAVVNFAHLYFEFSWNERAIPSPHRFLGYLYFRVDCNPLKYDGDVIFDSLAISILPICGFREADLMVNPCYSPDLDPKIKAEVEIWKKNDLQVTHDEFNRTRDGLPLQLRLRRRGL
ncbi:MAG: hypothetical protein IJU03_08385 [Thermoguttaceae bacterium]|nr:hypothetical protein [Thermoguttaceae bacterium]